MHEVLFFNAENGHDERRVIMQWIASELLLVQQL